MTASRWLFRHESDCVRSVNAASDRIRPGSKFEGECLVVKKAFSAILLIPDENRCKSL